MITLLIFAAAWTAAAVIVNLAYRRLFAAAPDQNRIPMQWGRLGGPNRYASGRTVVISMTLLGLFMAIFSVLPLVIDRETASSPYFGVFGLLIAASFAGACLLHVGLAMRTFRRERGQKA